jgi:hypothetical protein
LKVRRRRAHVSKTPRHAEAEKPLRAMMAEVLASPPEFIDLEVVAEGTLPSH